MNNLDVLRALAVLLVLADHVAEAAGIDIRPYNWALGRAGVILFFVHTSLVLCQSMERLRLHRWQLVRSFWIRRAFRLYPLAIVAILMIVAFDIPRMPHEAYAEPSAIQLAANLALVQNLIYQENMQGPLWSLPIEAQMYAALPFIYMLVRKWPPAAIPLLLVALALGVAQPYVSDRLDVLRFAPCFMAGVLAFTVPRGTLPAWMWPVALLVVVAVYIPSANALWAQWVLAFIVGAMVMRFRDLPKTFAHHVAKYSYGIYLFQVSALWLTVILPGPMWLRWIAAFAALAGLSVGLYHLVERPCIDYGARLARFFTILRRHVPIQAERTS
jgi:peptidoglycan/LPS O-acetylase OafA/YrhL